MKEIVMEEVNGVFVATGEEVDPQPEPADRPEHIVIDMGPMKKQKRRPNPSQNVNDFLHGFETVADFMRKF